MTLRHFGRFATAGCIAYAFEMGTLYTLYKVLHNGPLFSAGISFWVGFAFSFVLQKLITFQNYDRRHHVIIKQLVAFIFLVAWNYAFTLGFIALFSKSVSVFILRTVDIWIISTWNFILYKKIFKVRD